MPDDNPDFDFGERPLPEGLLRPWGRSSRRTLVLLGLIVAVAAVAGTLAWWQSQGHPETPTVIKHDPIEDDPAMRLSLDAADRETQRIIANDPPDIRNQLGYCQRVWAVKKEILREKYGVEWRTPAEMNPNVAFD